MKKESCTGATEQAAVAFKMGKRVKKGRVI
jgi:hypothetical protein